MDFSFGGAGADPAVLGDRDLTLLPEEVVLCLSGQGLISCAFASSISDLVTFCWQKTLAREFFLKSHWHQNTKLPVQFSLD